MTSISIVLFCNFAFILQYSVNSYEVNGFCGRPEKPFNSRLIPDKTRYSEGEVVTFQCNQYWNYLQEKHCIRGKWVGMQFRCGKTVVDSDVNYVKVEDISGEESIVLFDNNITLIPNYKFPNSFLSSRSAIKFEVQSDRRLRWTLGLQKPVSLPFFKISFHLLNVSVDKSLSIDFSANASVGPFRTCRHVFHESKKMWRFGTKVGVNFECNANSQSDYEEDMKSPLDQIIIETKTSALIGYKFIALFLAQSYGLEKHAVCGEPQMPFGTIVRNSWPDVNYSVDCLDSMNYVPQENDDLPDTTIHKQKCIYDMRWNGSFPVCVPKSVCPSTEDQQNQINPIYRVVRIDDVFYLNETLWYAIDGTTIHYQCNNPLTEILLGDAIHVCKNGKWIGTEPNCFDISGLKKLNQKNKAIEEDIDVVVRELDEKDNQN